MKVQKIEIVNFKNIAAQTLDLGGRHLYVIGGNGRGKSSFIEAVFGLLTGQHLPDVLTRNGEKNGYIGLDLADYRVEATFTAKTEKLNLRVSTPDGAEYKSPRTMLDKLVGTVDFDITGFLAKTPRKQAEYLKEVVGLDFSALDALEKSAFDERTFVNRRVKELEAQFPGEVPGALVARATSELQAALADVAAAQRQRDGVENRTMGLEADLGRAEARVRELEVELATEKKRAADLLFAIAESNDWLDTNPAPDAEALQAELTEVLAHNAAVAAQQPVLAGHAQLANARAQQNELNGQLQAIAADKAAQLAARPLPVPGLAFGEDGGLTLDGLPFGSAQTNTARLLIAGLQIGRFLHRDVAVSRIDASLLDKNNRAEVLAWADAHDVQLFVELVDAEGGALRLEVVETGVTVGGAGGC